MPGLVGGRVIVGIRVDTRERIVSSEGVGAVNDQLNPILRIWRRTYETIRGIRGLLEVENCWMPTDP